MVGETTEEKYKQRIGKLKTLGVAIHPNLKAQEVYNILKADGNKTEGTIKTYIVALLNYIGKTKGFEKVRDDLYNMMMRIKGEINNEVGKNELQGKQIENYEDWTKIEGVYTKMKNQDNEKQVNYKKLLIVSLYVLFPPRRIQDYTHMYVVPTRQQTKDTTKNYYVNTKEGYYIFNVYKTKKQLRQQIFGVPKGLDSIIKHYISTYGVIGRLLDYDSDGSLIKRLHEIFNDELKKSISVDILRHSYITYRKQKGMTVNESKLLASQMGHGVQSQSEYDKFKGKGKGKGKGNKIPFINY